VAGSKLIIFTCSDDGTVNRLEPHLQIDYLRINLDRPETWTFEASPDNWRLIADGREVTAASKAFVWWWKAFLDDFEMDSFLKAEIEYITHELYRDFLSKGLFVGNDFLHHEFKGKRHYLKSAKRFFRTPDFLVSHHGTWKLSTDDVVAKSLASSPFSSKKVLYTTRVKQTELNFENTWFLQEYIDSEWDITVLLVGHRVFGFQRRRATGKTVDWRKEQSFSHSAREWSPVRFSADEMLQLSSFTKAENLLWGRLDFLRSKSGELVFLEVNANGQFGFLDPLNEFGLFTSVAEYLSVPPE
jgi:hypothetical protein